MTIKRTSGCLCGVLLERAKPYLITIFIQFGMAGMTIICMYALNQGMSHFTLVVYRHIVAATVIAPSAIYFEWKVRPKMTLSIVLKIMALGLLEPVLDQNLYYEGMKRTSATFTSAMANVIPAITFVMAFLFRLEKVNIKKLHSQAKVIGTLVTVAGAMVMTLYKGPIWEMEWTKGRISHAPKPGAGQRDMVKGSLMLVAATFCWSGFFVLQTMTLRAYQAPLTLTLLICIVGVVEGGVVALLTERGNPAAWALNWDVKLLAAVYGGIICSGISYYAQGIVMKKRDPVFVSAFSPLSMIVVVVLGSFILAEGIYLGSVIGALIIVVGLYSVVWGKSKDHMLSSSSSSSSSVDDQMLSDGLPTAAIKPHELLTIGIAKSENQSSGLH